jgi:hypothetical protein|tara:strand:+ start:1191 stop:1478 length:288 start_codon:yes stop_codon:yes gene_type:complete
MAGTRRIFTRTLLAAETITIIGEQGLTTISVLCKTDNSGAGGISVLGNMNSGNTISNEILLKANESLTVSGTGEFDIEHLVITAGAVSTAIITGT